MLIVFSGLPAVGKTTISRLLAEKTNAVYLRIDSIEQALITSGEIKQAEMGGAGYFVAYAVARDNLKLGRMVIADCVNPIELTRNAWKQIANQSASKILNIEIICSDQIEHQRRAETRKADIQNHQLPKWSDIIKHDYDKNNQVDFKIDSAQHTADESVNMIISLLKML